MSYAEQLQSILEQYRADIDHLEKTRKPTDGLLGFGKKPGDDACHELMDRQAAALLEQLAQDPGTAEIPDVMRLVFTAGADASWPGYAHWALLAVQRHILPLIPRLAPAEAAELSRLYDGLCPKRERMPVQKQIAKALARGS